jgi:hypothetical protein
MWVAGKTVIPLTTHHARTPPRWVAHNSGAIPQVLIHFQAMRNNGQVELRTQFLLRYTVEGGLKLFRVAFP